MSSGLLPAAMASYERVGLEATRIGPNENARRRTRHRTLRDERRFRGGPASQSCSRHPSGHRRIGASADLAPVPRDPSPPIGQAELLILVLHDGHLVDERVNRLTAHAGGHAQQSCTDLLTHRAQPGRPKACGLDTQHIAARY